MSMNYSEKIADAIKFFLIEEDWNYDFQKEKGIFRFGVNLKNRIRNVQYIADVRETDYIIYGLIPISVKCDDAAMMMRMAEFISRANYGLSGGNFELDFRDGEIRFKCYVNCNEIDFLPRAIIEHSIYYPAAIYEQYGDGILKIIFFDISAEDAVALCESRQCYEGTDDTNDVIDTIGDCSVEMDYDEEDSESNESDDSSITLIRILKQHLEKLRIDHMEKE